MRILTLPRASPRRPGAFPAVAGLLFAALLATAQFDSSAAQNGATPLAPSPATRKEPNSRVVSDAQGRRIVEMRWSPGRSGEVVTLRVPENYIWQGGGGVAAALGPNYPDPNVVGPYTEDFILEVLLPDFQPKTPDNADRFKEGIGGETVRIIVSVAPPTARQGGPIIDALFRGRLRMIHPTIYERLYQRTLASMPDRFGLKHIGPIGDFEQFRVLGSVDDLYFPEHDPKDVFMVCGAEEIKDATEDRSWRARPLCQHFFYSRELGAVLSLRYRRIYLSRWPDLQERAARLVSIFQSKRSEE